MPFDTPGLEVSASPVDSFGSAPARLLDRLTTFLLCFHAATGEALAIGWSPTANGATKEKPLRKTPVAINPLVEGRYPSTGSGSYLAVPLPDCHISSKRTITFLDTVSSTQKNPHV